MQRYASSSVVSQVPPCHGLASEESARRCCFPVVTNNLTIDLTRVSDLWDAEPHRSPEGMHLPEIFWCRRRGAGAPAAQMPPFQECVT
eukprot:s6793_g3.t1